MSEELLQKFLSSIEKEDGIAAKTRKVKGKRNLNRENVRNLLQAASKGQLELSPEESYIIQKPSTSRGDYIDDRLAAQGFSLIDQVRAHKPKDLKKRNLKYMKYQESRKLDPKKGRILVQSHLKSKPDLKSLRKKKAELIGVKEPRRVIPGKKSKNKVKSKQASGSVFSDSDFASISRGPKRNNTVSDHSFL